MPRMKRALRRKNDIKKARRKRAIECSHRDPAWMEQSRFDNLHQYSKDMPQQHYPSEYRKTKSKKYGSKFNPSANHKRHIERMKDATNEYLADI